jgi:hypothetical protein
MPLVLALPTAILVATVILALVNAFTWLRDESDCEDNFWGSNPTPARVRAQSHPRD